MNKTDWKPFWFESNASWGQCNSLEDWLEVRGNYLKHHDSIDISKARMATYGKSLEECSDNQKTNFGFRWEHCGKYTLEDFARDNGMEL